jgi:hypothetical protein
VNSFHGSVKQAIYRQALALHRELRLYESTAHPSLDGSFTFNTHRFAHIAFPDK